MFLTTNIFENLKFKLERTFNDKSFILHLAGNLNVILVISLKSDIPELRFTFSSCFL